MISAAAAAPAARSVLKPEQLDKATAKIPQVPKSPTAAWDIWFPFSFSNEEDNPDGGSVATGGSADQTVVSQSVAPVPERLVDFFCVVGPKLDSIKEFPPMPKDLKLEPKLLDCYPKYRAYVEFPDELPMFCLPNGSRLSTEMRPPTLATFVLTSSAGNRLYGSVLTCYELIPLEELCEAFWAGGCRLPSWLEESRPFHLPKCLVVFSHHAFFDVQRTFLSQLHRLYTCGRSPLPLERYVANFVHDVPLPRPGAAKISWNCFTKDTTVTYERPATNELPLVNYSYQPIFRCLSVSNILALWGVLLDEGRVVLQSENQALLTPVAEALTSFLFPLTWQGMYVPVLPSHMLDILEAPVPFIVGFVGSACPQPSGVVVCDLDQDIVHLGTDEYGQSRSLPHLPKTLITNLKLELEEVADPLYLIPPCGIKGRVTSAIHGLLENCMRESYGNMVELRERSLTNTYRNYILMHANLLPPSKAINPGDFILFGEEQTKYQSLDPSLKPKNRRECGSLFKALKRQSRAIQAQASRTYTMSAAAVKQYDKEMGKNKFTIAVNLYKVDEDLAASVRYSFLRFFSTLLMHYKDFTKNESFRHEAFVESFTGMSHGNRLFVESMVKTQMFERFLVESSTRRRLFDEHVQLQLNESILARRKDTPFLDQQLPVNKVIIPAAPCSVGVSRAKEFSYEKFPKLDSEELVAHKNLDPVSAFCYFGTDMLCGGGTQW